jgi:hypothetical protein
MPQQQPPRPDPVVTPLPPVSFGDSRQAMTQQVEVITGNVVAAVREVMKVAQDLENLVVQNAARVKVELDEHVELAGAVKKEAAQLGGIIKQLRDAQAAIAAERKNGHGH